MPLFYPLVFFAIEVPTIYLQFKSQETEISKGITYISLVNLYVILNYKLFLGEFI